MIKNKLMITVILWDDLKDVGAPTAAFPRGKPNFSYMYLGTRAVKPRGYPCHDLPEVRLNGKWVSYESSGLGLSEIGDKVPKGFIQVNKGSPLFDHWNKLSS